MNDSQNVAGDDSGLEEDSTAQPNLALLFQLNEERTVLKRRRKRAAALLIAFLIVGFGVSLFLGLYFLVPETTSENNPRAPNTLVVKSEQVSGDYVLKNIEYNKPDGKHLALSLYDFDANRFIKGKKDISSPQLLEKLLDDKREALKGAEIVIFAGASFEGKPDDNRELTRRRACYVGTLLIQKLQIDSGLVWMIAVGEYKSPDFVGSDEEIREDQVLNSANNESILGIQRRLILLTVPLSEARAAKQNNAEEGLGNLIKLLREQNFLPTSYDHGQQSEPTLMSRMDCNR